MGRLDRGRPGGGGAATRARRLAVAVVWAGTVAGVFVWARSRSLSAVDAAEELRGLLADRWWGPLLFVAVYVARPVVLFPASVLTVLGGLAFGPLWGLGLTVVASNASTAALYGIGRFFGSEGAADAVARRLQPAVARPFEVTLLARLVYLPFDAVGYAAGFVRLRFWPFLAGSALGTLPGAAAFVGFGASVTSLDAGRPAFDLRVLAASIILAVAGASLARRLRDARPNETASDTTTSNESPPST